MYIQVELTLTILTVYEHYKVIMLYIIEQGCLHLLHLFKLPYSVLVFLITTVHPMSLKFLPVSPQMFENCIKIFYST